MPDFEHDEIRDSSFPDDFNDEKEALDMYGVWVKSGPRDVSSSPYDEVDDGESTIDDDKILPDFEEYSDISDFEELPDIPDMEDVTETDLATLEPDSENITDVDISFDSFDMEDDSTEEIESSLDETQEFARDASEIDKIDSLIDDSVEEPQDEILEEISDFDMEVEESSEDNELESPFLEPEMEIGIDTIEKSEITNNSDAIDDELPDADDATSNDAIDAIDDFDFSDIIAESDDTIAEDTVDDELPDADDAIDDFDFSDIIAESDDTIAEDTVDDELSDADVADMINEAEKSEKKETTDVVSFDEEDFSSLLDDINSSSPPSTSSESSDFDDLNLDDFINEINDSGGSSDKDKEKLFIDQEPIDIDLEFDEDFIESAEKIRAGGSLISEAEFEKSEFGVEMIDETYEEEQLLDDSFKDKQKDSDDSFDIPSPTDPIADDNLKNASEFDDLLASLDNAKPTVHESNETKNVHVENEYNIMVTEEDGLESVAATTTQEPEDDDFSVPLFDDSNDEEIELDVDGSLETLGSISEEETPHDELVSFDSLSIGETEIEVIDDSFDNSETLIENEITDMEIKEIKDTDNLEISEEEQYTEPQNEPDHQGSSDIDNDISINFDDVGAFEESLRESDANTGDTDVTSNEKSTELLMLIAEELSSIKKELSTLNTELTTTKTGISSTGDVVEETVATEDDNTGFFSDDDPDETIALTGDELNNILITADFTEEKNNEEEQISEDDFADISLAEDVTSSENTEVESALDIPETLDDDIFNQDIATQEISVSHINKVEDDISYLDGDEEVVTDLDDVAIEEPELETIDFNEENLEEPELTEFNIDFSEIEQKLEEDNLETELEKDDTETDIETNELADIESFDDIDLDSADFEAEVEAPEAEVEAPEAEIEVPEAEIEDLPTQPETIDTGITALPVELKDEIKSVLSYMDQLLESLPENKIEEFARSEHFDVYKKLFEELGIT